ncbi:putative F-box domain-containing protein [Tanacetum coccineum]|uniref:F-box domain-containing protein n=1 Tax=Tanacetum coccineum TaxID=301880 RepID=A0ABQ5I226_9ASTR
MREASADASSSKKFNACDNNASTSWANLNQDLLLSIMMQLGVVDFFSFKRVCKLWRKLAFDHNDKFMRSRQPMSISFSTGAKKECYLDDFEGRKFKTILPHSIGSTCVGITCGYVILFGRKTRDFWLVNPITRHEFHFSSFPFYVSKDTTSIRAILVNVPPMSRSPSVFVITHRFSSVISFSLAGNQPSIHDLHSFKGKIYTIDSRCCLCELRLNPEPTLRLLTMKNIPEPRLLRPEFVNSDQNLYVIDCILKDVTSLHDVDFERNEMGSTD